jgi:hypothetical protein
MTKFYFYYSETETYRATLEAESLEHAKALLRDAENGEHDLSDLTQNSEICKGYELNISYESVKAVTE